MSRAIYHVKMGSIWTWLLVSSLLCYGVWIVRMIGGDRNINRDFVRIFGWGIRVISGVDSEVLGQENIDPAKNYVLVGNHQSGLDVGILGMSCPRNTVVIGKVELAFIPLFGLLFAISDNLLIPRQKKRKSHEVIGFAAKEILRRRVSVYLFPEGTRNRTDDFLLPFKKGAFHMAIKARVPVVPVVCQRLGRFFDKKNHAIHPGTVRIQILPPVETAGMDESDIDRLTEIVRQKMLDALRAMESAPYLR